MTLKEFTVNPNSGFVTDNGQRVKRGDWYAPYFAYWTNEETGRQYLIVGPTKEVTIDKKVFQLQPVPEGCNIKDMEGLEKPVVAKKYRKLINLN
jgi:hypothetical protein